MHCGGGSRRSSAAKHAALARALSGLCDGGRGARHRAPRAHAVAVQGVQGQGGQRQWACADCFPERFTLGGGTGD